MYALRAYAKDDPSRLVYEQAPKPFPQPFPQDGEVVVRVHASGVAPGELTWRTTWVNPDGSPRPLPIVPGHEVAGEVDEVSLDADGLKVGQSVFGLIDFQRDGAAAEYVAARATELAPMPPGLSNTDAAAAPLSALTAWQALFEHGALAAGERILIHGAASGDGGFAVQFAHWRGAHVIASADAATATLMRELGADEVIDEHTQRFEDVTGMVDVIFDTVGGEIWERSWDVLDPGGRLVSVALPRPPDEDMPDGARSIWFAVTPRRDQLAEIADLVVTGHVRPVVSHVRPLAAGRNAYDTRNHAPGKIVLRVTDESR